MSLDIGNIMDEWPYEQGRITARRILGDDGQDKIQMRLDLGLYQMEATGRPDGQRPHGFDSLFSYYEHLLEKHRQETGADEGFTLDEAACEALRTEALMYYHRYLAEFILEDYEAVERDTLRNIRLMDFCIRFAKERSDRFMLEQYRPYVIMMNTRARALQAFRRNRMKAALAALKQGIEAIKDFHQKFGQENSISNSSEIAILRAMAKEIEASVPENPLTKLRRELAKAIREERYEEAAHLRDKLRLLDQVPEPVEEPPLAESETDRQSDRESDELGQDED